MLSKNRRLVAAIVILLAGLAALLLSQKYLTCQVFYSDDATVTAGNKKIRAEIADSSKERTKGLSGRNCIKSDQGMLFVFDRPGMHSFWMKDMKFAIDIIWLDEKFKPVKVESRVSPNTYPKSFANARPAKYVLELKSGQAVDLGIKEGGPPIRLMLK